MDIFQYSIIFCIAFSITQYIVNHLYCGALKEMYKQESHIEDEDELANIMSYQIKLAEAKQDAFRNVVFCWLVLFSLIIIHVFFDFLMY